MDSVEAVAGSKIRSLPELVGACLAVGLDGAGGPLSSAESELLSEAQPFAGDAEALRGAIGAEQDPLGEAYNGLRTAVERRKQGAFYTPDPIVRAMVAWVLSRAPARVVDAGCGSGRFAAEVARKAHQTELVAVDLDPVATIISRAVLTSLGTTRARVLNADYLTAELGRVAGRTAFVGNPPYVRHHDIDPSAKAWARRVSERHHLPVPSLGGLHVHFFLATLEHGRDGDVGAFITSSEWLDVGYGRTVRAALLNDLGGESLHLLEREDVTFGDAMTTALVTCFELGGRSRRMRFHRTSASAPLDALGNGGVLRDQGALEEATRWTPLFSQRPARSADGMVRLGDIVRVSRGVATGCNGFFAMTRNEAEGWGIERWTRQALTRATEVLAQPGVVRADPSRRVLLAPPRGLDPAAEGAEPLLRYLAQGERAGVDQRYLCAHREPWWFVGAQTAPVVATYMARQPPAFALNPDGLAILNVFHGLYPRSAMEQEDLAGLVGYLNANREALRGAGRTYQGGLEKFEPGEMEALLVPSPTRLRDYAE
ncbi:MAG: methyltransferase [Armatimonadetes bacterium]|nr:methyltransferase [Armatimonadota bacterium]